MIGLFRMNTVVFKDILIERDFALAISLDIQKLNTKHLILYLIETP